MISRPKDLKPRVLNKYEFYKFRHKAQKNPKPFRTNPKKSIRIWVPKYEIVYVIDILKRNGKEETMLPEQWLLATHDRRKVHVPNPDHERGMKYGVWRKPERKDHWYEDYW